MFSNGAEVAWVVPPRLLEVARTSDVGSLLAVLKDEANSEVDIVTTILTNQLSMSLR